MRPVRALTLAAVLLATALTGCGSTGSTVTSSPPPASPGPVVTDTFPQRAEKLAAAWDGSQAQQTWESGFVPVMDEVNRMPSGAFRSSADKAAYLAGQFHVTVPLPTGPAQQTVRFDNGATLTLPAIDSGKALHTDTMDHCPASVGCPTWLTVTSAKATTERVRTSQGMATVPAWAFRIQGYDGDFVFAAVKPESLPKPVDLPRFNGYQGASLISVSADGRTLTIGAFLGCGMQKPTGLVFEAKDVVVVGSTEKPSPTPPDVCPASLAMVPVPVRLSAPLDGRTVLDVGTGLPQAPSRP